MTQAVEENQQRREEWIARVAALAQQIKGWCQSQGWAVEEVQKTIHEDLLGQ